MKLFAIRCMLCLLPFFFMGCYTQSKEVEHSSIHFEEHLIPSIQVKNEPRYYRLKDRMQHYHVPGLAVVIIKDGKIVLRKGYGLAQIEDSVKVTSKTLFQAGSIAKSITAVTVLKLVEKGILDLDKDISYYLTSWKLPTNKYTARTPITLRMLLSHTSGVNNSNHPGFPQKEVTPTLDQLLHGFQNYKQVAIDTLPGVRYKYSNTGYAILQKILEDVTQKQFNQLVTEEIFLPIGMHHSQFIAKKHTVNDTLVSYAYNRQGEALPDYWYNAANKASGGLWTTAEDLGKFILTIQNALHTKNEVISQEMARQMLIPVKEKYGLGFNIKQEKDSTIFYHTGKNRGFTNIMMGMADAKNGIVILTNGDQGGYLFLEIARGVSDLEQWNFSKPKTIETVTVPQKTMDSYLGTYQLDFRGKTYIFQVLKNGKHLQLFDKDEQVYYPLRATSQTEFININDGEHVKFTKDTANRVNLLWDETYTFKKVMNSSE